MHDLQFLEDVVLRSLFLQLVYCSENDADDFFVLIHAFLSECDVHLKLTECVL